MKLFYYPGACSLADHIVLEWIGARYELVEVSREAVKSPEYLALNPGGNVPLLQHGDSLLTENVAILVYLAELRPEAKLLGDGSLRARADVLRWVAFINSDVHGAFAPIFSPQHFLGDERFADELARLARLHLRELLQRLEDQLHERSWLTGERSIADAYLFVILRWAFDHGVDMRGFDSLDEFLDRMYDDAGVQVALTLEEGLLVA